MTDTLTLTGEYAYSNDFEVRLRALTDPVARRESEGRQGPARQSRPSAAMAKSTKRIAFGAYQTSALRIL